MSCLSLGCRPGFCLIQPLLLLVATSVKDFNVFFHECSEHTSDSGHTKHLVCRSHWCLQAMWWQPLAMTHWSSQAPHAVKMPSSADMGVKRTEQRSMHGHSIRQTSSVGWKLFGAWTWQADRRVFVFTVFMKQVWAPLKLFLADLWERNNCEDTTGATLSKENAVFLCQKSVPLSILGALLTHLTMSSVSHLSSFSLQGG